MTQSAMPLRWKLANIAEHRVHASGILKFHTEFVTKLTYHFGVARMMEMPKRADGSSLVMKVNFFQRLLTDRLEVKGCMECDISAAHMDLRHLTLEQLLSIRAKNLDFETASESHGAHNLFLEAIDTHIAEKLGRRMLRGKVSQPVEPEALRTLGRRVVLSLGAAEMLASGWGVLGAGSESLPDRSPAVPAWWVIELDPAAWSGQHAAVFNATQFGLDLVPCGPLQDNSLMSFPGLMAVVCDSSSGIGKSRRFQWEITLLDQRRDNIFSTATFPAHEVPQDSTKIPLLAVEGIRATSPHSLGSIPRPLVSGMRSPRANGVAAFRSPRGIGTSPRPHTRFSQDARAKSPPAIGDGSQQAPRGGRRVGGRCPRASVAFLEGKVAGAVGRIEADTHQLPTWQEQA